MVATTKVEFREREVCVSLRCASFELALEVAWRNYALPPEGYRLDHIGIKRRNHSGRRAMLSLTFLHVDRRVAPLGEIEAKALFELDSKVAAGTAEYPKEER